MPDSPATRAAIGRLRAPLILLLLCALTAAAYWPGLGGPFMLDDGFRITQNPQVQITSLSPSSLEGAWRSLYFITPPPGARQLTQLTFALNYYVGGLSTWGYKATNLVIHLLNGCLVFLLMTLLARAWARSRALQVSDQRIELFALTATGLWLLQPLNLGAVLYINQRSTSLEALFVLAAMVLYVSGRIALARGSGGWVRILAAFPIALLGMFAKSNAVLFPVFALVFEYTLLRGLTPQKRPYLLRALIALGLVAPILFGAYYLYSHPALYTNGYAMRDFNLEQRVLTETRVLWFYIQLMIVPSPQALGLFHDDFPLSYGLFQPVTTALAIGAWSLVLGTALIFAKRLPWFAFAVLFYLGGQSLESSVIPLELVFEHRNYVPMIAVLALLARILTLPFNTATHTRRLLPVLAIVLGVAFAGLTLARAYDWRNFDSLVIAEAEHHPNSMRANFMVSQLFINVLRNRHLSEKDRQTFTQAATDHLDRMLKDSPGSPDALFGLLAVDLANRQQPSPALTGKLLHQLRYGSVGPTHLSISQYPFLVNWQLSEPFKLSNKLVSELFAAVLANPGMPTVGKANLYAVRARFEDQVLKDKQAALQDARMATRMSPKRWAYPRALIVLAYQLGHYEEASKALDQALQRGLSGPALQQAERLRKAIEKARQSGSEAPELRR